MTSGRVGPVDSEVYEMRVSECQALTRRLSDPRAACRMLAYGTRSYTSEGSSLPWKGSYVLDLVQLCDVV